jgi:hypothetical protein
MSNHFASFYSGITILDFAAISLSRPHRPPQLDFPPSGDAHYQCEMTDDGQYLVLNTHGGCTDVVNTVLVQAFFNHMCSPGFGGLP